MGPGSIPVQNGRVVSKPHASPARHRIAVVTVLLLALGGLVACARTPPASSMRTLDTSPSPSPDGWIELFDGEAVAGLEAHGGGPLPADRWTVSDGALRTIPGPGTDLVTAERFLDFELEFRWAVSPGGNSGVMIGVQDDDRPTWASGPEYQLLDDAGHPDGAEPTTAAAALYALLAPAADRRLAPVGELNRSRIVAHAGHVEHWLGDDLVLTYDWDDPALRAAIAESKFASEPTFMRERDGRLAFQHHGEAVWFAAIRIRRLPPAAAP
jgi:hypothetical protein